LADRRRYVRVLRHLAGASSRSESDMERRFGSSVHAELKALFLANHIEFDLGERRRWRLTASGRAEALRAMSARRAAA
jgi:hypothetical protein